MPNSAVAGAALWENSILPGLVNEGRWDEGNGKGTGDQWSRNVPVIVGAHIRPNKCWETIEVQEKEVNSDAYSLTQRNIEWLFFSYGSLLSQAERIIFMGRHCRLWRPESSEIKH
jgi:hypothetical protein